VQFVETSAFTRRVRKLLDMDAYFALQLHLLRNPAAGSILRGTGGLRKIRWQTRGRGKRGGVRVIYYWLKDRETILMLFAFGKSERADLSDEQRGTLRQVVERELR
jgi:mRNA-degrading endonuclease RelE of RelBE toxin-antitoxin system